MERINATTGSYNFIDLFAGAGGLSEGFIQAGFSPVAHVEMNPYAAQTLETRTGYYYLKAQGKLDIYKDYISGKITRDEFLQHIPEEQLQSVFCETMSNETLPRLFENIDRILTQRGIKQVDVIIGGPPCQAYSLVGRAQSKHMETPMSADPRNDLYIFVRFIRYPDIRFRLLIPVGKCYAENTFCRFKLWRGWSILICTFNFFDFCAITFNQSHPGEDSRKVRISRL